MVRAFDRGISEGFPNSSPLSMMQAISRLAEVEAGCRLAS
jgi:hypothetical protein